MATTKTASKEQIPDPSTISQAHVSASAEAPQSDVSATTDSVVTVSVSPTENVNRFLRYHVWAAMGVGLIPIPVADLVALTGVQVNLLRVLAKMYHVPFRKGIVRNLVSSLIGGALPIVTTPLVASSVTKVIPAIGQTMGVITMPILAGATTYALGKVFVQHFASGGTFLTFDPEKVKEYYTEMLKEGQTVAEDLKGR